MRRLRFLGPWFRLLDGYRDSLHYRRALLDIDHKAMEITWWGTPTGNWEDDYWAARLRLTSIERIADRAILSAPSVVRQEREIALNEIGNE